MADKQPFSTNEIKENHLSRAGFTLLEVILVVVLIVIITGVSAPYFAGSLRGSRLRTAARSIERLCQYSHSMAIMKNEVLTLGIDTDTMELFVGTQTHSTTNNADGQIDQSVLKRLHYIDSGEEDFSIDKEFRRYLPEGLVVNDFEKEWNDEDHLYDNFCLVRFYPNGQCEWFKLELMDSRDNAIRMEIDPISGKIWSEYVQ